MNFNLRNILWAVAFILVAGAWFFGLKIDLTGDSGLYAAISGQMVESENWLDLKINGEPYDQKPHLFFWLAGLGIQLFGNTNFAYKLFLFFSGLSGIYFTYRIARLLFSETAGRLAALFAGTSQLFFLYFFDFHTDTVLQSAVILSLWQFAAYLEQQKTVNFIVAFTGVGLAMLTKGPVGAVLPFFFVLFYLLLKKDYRQLFHPKWLAGVLLVLFIISPTLYHLWNSFGAEGLLFYFIDNNIGRVSGEVAGSSTDPFFYLYNLLWAFLPWTVPVIAGLGAEIKSWFKVTHLHQYNASLMGSVMVLFVVYSIARGKAPNYLMMLIPPLAVVAAGRLQTVLTWPASRIKLLVGLQMTILASILLLLFAVLLFISPGEHPERMITIIAVVAVLGYLIFRVEHSLYKRVIFVSIVVIAAFNLFINTTVVPLLYKYQGSRQVLAIYKKEQLPEDKLYVFELEEYEIFFYDMEINSIKEWDHLFEVLNYSGTWIYTNQIKYDDLVNLGYEFERIYLIEQRGMNNININFLIHSTRQQTLTTNYLVKVR